MWNKPIETADAPTMRDIQSQRLRQAVERAWHVPAYRAKMEAVNVTPTDIAAVDDLRKLPFTTKTDLRDNYPYGLFAAPLNEVVRVHASSGTTSNPNALTAANIQRSGNNPLSAIHRQRTNAITQNIPGQQHQSALLGAVTVVMSNSGNR